MAVEALTDACIFANAVDLTGYSNEVGIEREVSVNERTTFASGGNREWGPGLKSATFNLKGFLDFADGSTDEVMNDTVFGATNVLSITADNAQGSVAYLSKCIGSKLTRPFKVGDDPLFDTSLVASTPSGVVRGRLLEAKATVSSGTNGTGYQLGAVAATEDIFAALHVFDVTGGGTLTVTLYSDDNGSFTSATSRHAFTAATDLTSEWAAVSGAITDDYWRVSWTLTAGTATFAVCAGIA